MVNEIKLKRNGRIYLFIAILLVDDANALRMLTLPGRQTKWL